MLVDSFVYMYILYVYIYIYIYIYTNCLCISLYINLYIEKKHMFLHCTIVIYIAFILFNQV